MVSLCFLIFGNLKINEFNSLESIKNNYKIRAISSKISLDRFYSNQDELKIINELMALSNPEKKIPSIFLWPEGIIPDTPLKDINIYKNLFSSNFGNDDIILMGIKNKEIKNIL